MTFFKSYLRGHRTALLLFFLSAGIFGLSCYLFRAPAEVFLYPACLALFLLLCVTAVDYLRLLKKHRELRRAVQDPLHCAGALPACSEALEEDYQELIAAIDREARAAAELQAANDADLRDYYTLWAHQIKTPISAVRLSLQNEDTPFSRQVGREIGRIERYVEMALTYLRLESPSSDYLIRSCELDAILRGALRKFAGEFIGRRLQLEFRETGERVLTDEKWLSFVVEQLLSNALKYTPQGTISISMEPGQVLCIRDTGIGIAPEDLPRIFEKGYTGYNGRQDQRASGIGLYLCKRVCGKLGHRIWAESELGKGTEVRIDLSRNERRYE